MWYICVHASVMHIALWHCVSQKTSWYTYCITESKLKATQNVLVSFPDPTMHARKGSGDIEAFSWSCAPIHDRTCSNTANNHMITELAEPRIGTNVPRPFPHMCSGVWERN